MIDYQSQSALNLLAIAARHGEDDAARCRLAFDHLAVATRMRRGLQHALTRHRLSELQFATLVVLSEAGPEPIPMAVLAGHCGVSRSAMTESLDKLEAQHLAERTRDRHDRRIIRVRITATGREKSGHAISDYLGAAGQAANGEGLERWSGHRMEEQPSRR
jgi:DNA-binding MarR family transcriptional regulator